MHKLGKDLSQGSVVKQLILFSLPFLLSNIIQSLYNMADMLIVGRFSGTASLSGVNIGGQVTLLLTNFIVGLCTGGTVLIAQYLGAKDQKAIKETIGTLFTTLIIAAAVITGLMLIFKNPVLQLIQTPAEAFAEAQNYLLITVLGIFFIFGYNALSAVMRGMGESKIPLYFVAVACVVNIILDLFLVGHLQMGARGAAIATVISQALSMLLCIIYLAKNNFIFDFKLSSFKLHKNRMTHLLKLGIPTSIQNVITTASFLILTTVVNIIGGVNASAAVGVVGKFNGFALMPALAMSVSISAMSAQNIGANEWERAKKTFKVGSLIGVTMSTLIFFIAQLFPAEILSLFNDEPQMIADGIAYMRSFSFDYIIVPWVFCLNGLFIGAGHSRFSLINNALSAIILRVPAGIFFAVSLNLGLTGIGLGAPIASIGSLILGIWFYKSHRWQKTTFSLN